MILYPRFYHRYGVRKIEQLFNPRRNSLLDLEMPRGSIYHYQPESKTDIGPMKDEYLYRLESKFIMLQNVDELTHFEGNPILKPIKTANLIRQHLANNRNYRRLKDFNQVERDEVSQVCINYSLIARRYRYPRVVLTPWFEWKNLQTTIIKNINEVANISNRQAFIKVKVPLTIPSVNELNRFSNTVNPQMLEIFHSDELKFLLELWKWFGPERKNSLLNLIDAKNLSKINLLFLDKNVWFVLNLGTVNSWRKATPEELALAGTRVEDVPTDTVDEDGELITSGVEPIQVAKLFLRGLLEFNKNRFVAHVQEEEKQDIVEEDKDGEETEIVGQVKKTESVQVITPTEAKEEPKLEEEKEDRDPTIIDFSDSDAIIDFSAGKVLSGKDELREIYKESEIIDLTAANDKGFKVNNLLKMEAELDDYFEVINEANDEISEKGMFDEMDGEIEIDPSTEIIVDLDPSESFKDIAKSFAEVGVIKPTDFAKFEKLSQKYKEIKLDNGQTVEEFIKIDKEDLKIKEPEGIEVEGILDSGILGSTLDEFDSKYVSDVLEKDVMSSLLGIQSAGFAVTDITKKEVEDISGAYTDYTMRVNPLDGVASTIKFKLPKVNEDGTYVFNGVTYRLSKQQGVHMPIKKTDSDTVALTSYYGKIFINRPERKAADYGSWLTNQIRLKNLDEINVFDAELGSDYKDNFKAPRVFSYIAKEVLGFKTKLDGVTYQFYFGINDREKIFSKEILKQLEINGARVVGIGPNSFIIVDSKDTFQLITSKEIKPLGDIETILQIDKNKAPLEYTEMGVMSKDIPIGFILGYEKGIARLLKEVKAEYRMVKNGERLKLVDGEYALRFADQSLVLNRKQVYVTLLFAGFTKYRNSIAQYNIHEFNSKPVYLNVLEESGLSSRILGEVDLRYRMFIDPITHELLVGMKEPTNFGGLMRRATQMLVDDHVPKVKDRIRGYERFAGTVYQELVRSVRSHYNRHGRDRVPLDFNPFVVEKAIDTDSSKRIVNDINPIEDLKQMESITYTGTGGRSSRTMVKRTRAYDDDFMGLVSEATVDSSKVAVNAYTSANPKLNSVRGTYDSFELNKDDPSRLVSTSMMVSPGADRDDSNRVKFINIQHGHGISCDGYMAPVVRTGYEQVIGTRTTDKFATIAKEDGRVISIKKDGIIVEYKSGKRIGVNLGKIFGQSSNLTFPFNIRSDLKPGQTFKRGTVIAYNEQFFEPDFLNPSGVVMKLSTPITVALMENASTYEDSSAISLKAGQSLSTNLTTKITVFANSKQKIHDVKRVGTEVKASDHLCILEDETISESNLFDSETLDSLRTLGAQAPRATVNGIVERIEVIYNDDIENMSKSIASIAMDSDRELASRRKNSNKSIITGKTPPTYRLGKDVLMPGNLVIIFYITAKMSSGVGDKLVFGNQLKTIIGDVMEKPMISEHGVEIDAKFGSKAVGDRIVNSPYLIGTASILSKLIAKKAISAYRGNL